MAETEKFSVSMPQTLVAVMDQKRGERPRSSYLADLVQADAEHRVARPVPQAARRALSSTEARAGARATPKAKP